MRKWLSYASSSNWLRVVGVGTIILLAAYLMAQQSTRQAANDLPLMTAQTAVNQLAAGASPQSVVPAIKANIGSPNTIFVVITDSSKNILASSSQLGDPAGLPPATTFDYAKAHAVDTFTWQPSGSLRLATVILPYSTAKSTGYVIAGQSLAPAEHRIDIYGWDTLAAWVGIVVWAAFIPIPSISSKK